MSATEIIRYLTALVLAGLALVAFVGWRRRGGSPARWAFLSLALLAAITGIRVAVRDAEGALAEAVAGISLTALPLFPFFLFRFAAALRPPPRTLEWLAGGLTGAALLTALVSGGDAIGSDARSAIDRLYLVALVVQWTALSVIVAVRLWRAGHGQATVARRRMRTLSAGSIGLTLVIVAAAAGGSLGAAIRLFALASALLFAIAFAPPAWLRSAWRRPEEEHMRRAIAALVGTTTRIEAAAAVLPHVPGIVGAPAAALVDEHGEVLATQGIERDRVRAAMASTPAIGHGTDRVSVDVGTARLLVWVGPYTPYFGQEELELLHSLGASVALALDRVVLSAREQQALDELRRQVEFSELLVDSSVDGILAFDRELRYTIWNPGMERITGLGREEVLGRAAPERFPFLVEIAEVRHLRDALEGRTTTTTDQPYVVPETGREGFFESRYSPLYGPSGDIIGGLGIVREVTDRRRAQEERERRLAEQAARARAEATADTMHRLQGITDAALASLNLDELTEALLERMAAALEADTAAILLLDRDAGELVVQATRGLEEEVERRLRIPVGRGFAGRVAAERRAVRLDRVTREDVVSDVLLERGVVALLGVPLIASKRLIGVAHVGSLHPRRFTDEDATLLELVADRVALGIDHARLYRRQHDIAETLQRSLLPERLPRVPDTELAARYLPAGAGAVGGDWYDVLELPGGRIGVAVGDVLGHGIGAASLMGELRSGLRAYALDGAAPGEVLRRLDHLLDHSSPEFLATAVYLVLEPETGRLRFSAAGHLPPLLREAGGAVRRLEGGRAVALGALAGADAAETAVRVRPGDTVVAFTDGLVERRGESIEAGLARLAAAIAGGPPGAEALADHLLESLLPAGTGADDAALVVIRPCAPTGGAAAPAGILS